MTQWSGPARDLDLRKLRYGLAETEVALVRPKGAASPVLDAAVQTASRWPELVAAAR